MVLLAIVIIIYIEMLLHLTYSHTNTERQTEEKPSLTCRQRKLMRSRYKLMRLNISELIRKSHHRKCDYVEVFKHLKLQKNGKKNNIHERQETKVSTSIYILQLKSVHG